MNRSCCPFLAVTLWASSGVQAYTFPVQDTANGNAEIVAHFEAGQQASQAGQFDRAVEEYKAVLRLDPALTEARVNLGLAYHAVCQYGLAAGELEKAVRQRPDLVA